MLGRSPQAGALFGACAPATALCLMTLGAVLAAPARPPARGPVAMVFPPWWGAARTFAAAAAAAPVIGQGGAPFVAIVAPDTTAERASLTQAGAWLLLDPAGLPGCLAAAD